MTDPAIPTQELCECGHPDLGHIDDGTYSYCQACDDQSRHTFEPAPAPTQPLGELGDANFARLRQFARDVAEVAPVTERIDSALLDEVAEPEGPCQTPVGEVGETLHPCGHSKEAHEGHTQTVEAIAAGVIDSHCSQGDGCYEYEPEGAAGVIDEVELMLFDSDVSVGEDDYDKLMDAIVALVKRREQEARR